MHSFRRHRSAIGLFAALAILLSAVMPTISHVIAAEKADYDFLSAICSTGNSKIALNTIPPDSNNSRQDQAPSKPMTMEHCAYCSMQAHTFGIIASHELVVAKLALSQPLPTLFYHAPYPLYAWVSANPRAPPIFS